MKVIVVRCGVDGEWLRKEFENWRCGRKVLAWRLSEANLIGGWGCFSLAALSSLIGTSRKRIRESNGVVEKMN